MMKKAVTGRDNYVVKEPEWGDSDIVESDDSMEMSVWSWMLLVLLLPAAGSLDVENWLTPTVKIIRTEYNISKQFCVAVNIPVGQNPDQLLDVLQNDRYEKVEEVMKNNTDLYIGTRVVAAKPHVEHAEFRVLHNMDGLYNQSQDNFLVFYTYLSPCALQCANPGYRKNILNTIWEIPSCWGERYALVFGKPCTRLGEFEITREQLKKSFIHLKEKGVTNIFRCYFQNVYQCHSCSPDQNQNVSEVCLEGAESEQGGSAGSSQDVSTGGKRGSAEGTSRSATAKRQKGPK
ncbi:uncharacterized protein LOC122991683 isoform X4 [Thunnus albacares]|uniref:uncharacterized protein LOC122991683 isoform X4 n=1 Tax=Thunnus albacares TaxID=8236 RepID=UPI001CF6260D|nr:uncharacterized protein LOC122991683 isoform X4 [Thunnus albacares]